MQPLNHSRQEQNLAIADPHRWSRTCHLAYSQSKIYINTRPKSATILGRRVIPQTYRVWSSSIGDRSLRSARDHRDDIYCQSTHYRYPRRSSKKCTSGTWLEETSRCELMSHLGRRNPWITLSPRPPEGNHRFKFDRPTTMTNRALKSPPAQIVTTVSAVPYLALSGLSSRRGGKRKSVTLILIEWQERTMRVGDEEDKGQSVSGFTSRFNVAVLVYINTCLSTATASRNDGR